MPSSKNWPGWFKDIAVEFDEAIAHPAADEWVYTQIVNQAHCEATDAREEDSIEWNTEKPTTPQPLPRPGWPLKAMTLPEKVTRLACIRDAVLYGTAAILPTHDPDSGFDWLGMWYEVRCEHAWDITDDDQKRIESAFAEFQQFVPCPGQADDNRAINAAIRRWLDEADRQLDMLCVYRDRHTCGPGDQELWFELRRDAFLPDFFSTDTATLVSWVEKYRPGLSVGPILEIASALQTFFVDESASNVAAQSTLTAKLTEAAIMLKRARASAYGGSVGRPITDVDGAVRATDICANTNHSDDFTSVNWFGKTYRFTKGNQAESVKALWTAWEEGGHSLSQEAIKEKIGSGADKFNLKKTFRLKQSDGKNAQHPAWRTMIRSTSKGTYCLVPSEST